MGNRIAFFLGAAAAAAVAVTGCQHRNPVDPVQARQNPPIGISLVDVLVPADMALIPGGYTDIGSEDGMPEERPVFNAGVATYLMDKHPVTVAEFRSFVDSTGFVTQAETFGDAGLLVDKQWALVRGASWRTPLGPDADPAADDHPVTQVSWNDARSYCEFVDKRLPTEVEWEHAARGGTNDRNRYAWGSELKYGDEHRANTWQGTFPEHNRNEDGFLYTSPVGTFGETLLGLSDMGGNVWEWTSDWFRPYGDGYAQYTPNQSSEKVQRGGSFLCNEDWCHGFRVSARSHSSAETSLFHVGFRCARSV